MKKIILTSITSSLLASVLFANVNYGSVNGEKITNTDINMIIRDPKIQYKSLSKDIQKKILNQAIDTKLLSQNAIKSNIVKDKVFKETLKRLKDNLALELWMQKESQKIKVTEKESKEFYKKNKNNFIQKAALKARHILVDTKESANKLIEKLRRSKDLKSKFIELAKKHSTGPSAINGGDLGWFEPAKMVPEFSKAAQKLKKDSITTKPVKTQFGYHIIYLEDKKEKSTVNYSDVKDKIKQLIMQDKFLKNIKNTVTKLKAKAKIKINK